MKKQITFTIEEKIYEEFSNLSKKLSLNKSLFVENCLVEYLLKNKEIINDNR